MRFSTPTSLLAGLVCSTQAALVLLIAEDLSKMVEFTVETRDVCQDFPFA
ncbi:hypothetical protein BJY04DRAFT_213379 [Aspergillus karnatakaensis]